MCGDEVLCAQEKGVRIPANIEHDVGLINKTPPM